MPTRVGLIGLALCVSVQLAQAHPHIWITNRVEVVFDVSAHVVALNHAWTFDESFSAFGVQGLDTDKDGRYSREELLPLAEAYVKSLRPFGYFTVLKAQGKPVAFEPPKDSWLEHKDGRLVLHFTLPLKAPAEASADGLSLDIDDPTFYVALWLDKEAPVTLAGAPSGCKADIPRPAGNGQAASAKLSEFFLQSLNGTDSYGTAAEPVITISCR